MTTYRCCKCGTWWTSGPTRDVRYDKPCADCLIKVLKETRKELAKYLLTHITEPIEDILRTVKQHEP